MKFVNIVVQYLIIININKMSKESAVEWLDEQLQDIMNIEYGVIDGVRKVVIPLEDYMILKQQAKAMEKEQIIDAFDYGYIAKHDSFGSQYYNEKYNNQK